MRVKIFCDYQDHLPRSHVENDRFSIPAPELEGAPRGLNFSGNHLRTYAHVILEHLPNLLWLNTQPNCEAIHFEQIPAQTTTIRSFIETLNIDTTKIHFTSNTESDMFNSGGNGRCVAKWKLYREHVERLGARPPADTMIYCTRNTGGGTGRRRMNPEIEKQIIDISREFCDNHGLNMVVFDGKHNNRRMTIRQQIDLFKRAKVVVGPHGGAFANIINIPKQNECVVCEFTSDKYIAQKGGRGFMKNYAHLFKWYPLTYLDYSLVPFSEGTNFSICNIDVQNYINWLNNTNGMI